LDFIVFISFIYSGHKVWFKFFVFNGTRVVGINYLEIWVNEFSLNWDSQFSNQVCDFINGQTLTSIQIEIIKDFPEELWIILCKLEYSSFHFGMQMLYGSLGYFSIFVFWALPSSFHHSYEILVTWSAHTKITVVVTEFSPGDLSIVITSWSIKVI